MLSSSKGFQPCEMLNQVQHDMGRGFLTGKHVQQFLKQNFQIFV